MEKKYTLPRIEVVSLEADRDLLDLNVGSLGSENDPANGADAMTQKQSIDVTLGHWE